MTKRGPTLEDVAREAGVSRATVSRVVNGVRNVDPRIQEVVRRAITRTGYTPNQAARSLVTRRTGAVALVFSAAGEAFAARVFADPFFGRVVDGALGLLRERAVQPVLLFAESEQARAQVVQYLGGGVGGTWPGYGGHTRPTRGHARTTSASQLWQVLPDRASRGTHPEPRPSRSRRAGCPGRCRGVRVRSRAGRRTRGASRTRGRVGRGGTPGHRGGRPLPRAGRK
ncbi:HTH-type transcriptional repressor PurR [Streptomyces glaucescens]